LNTINLEFKAGKIYGLLGRNGAGKSTLLKVIADRIKPTSGRILYDGEAMLDDVTSRDLYFSEPEKTMPDLMKVKELCCCTSRFYPRFNLAEALQVLKNFGVNEKNASTNCQRAFRHCQVDSGFADEASFIFLDEPTNGSDAVNRELLYNEILRIYREEENTIVLSTHLIDEISNLLEEVIFIDHGRIVLEERVEDILGNHSYLIGPPEIAGHVEKAYTVIKKREELGFTFLLVKQSGETPALPPELKLPTKLTGYLHCIQHESR